MSSVTSTDDYLYVHTHIVTRILVFGDDSDALWSIFAQAYGVPEGPLGTPGMHIY